MPAYAFTARRRDGGTVRGVAPAGSEAVLAVDLAAEGLTLLRARPREGRNLGRVKLKAPDLAAFLLHLATYLEAGLTLLDALRDFRDPKRPALEAVVMDMGQRLAAGAGLSGVLAVYPGLFLPLHVRMVQAGETTGRLDEALRAVIRLVEWEAAFRAQVREAATYPLILLGLLALIGVVVVTFSLPPILALLESFQVPLPLSTRILEAGFSLLRVAGGWVLAGALGLGFALGAALRRPALRLRWDTALLGFPGLGPLLQARGLSRFAQFFGAQYRAGIPVMQALRACEGVTGNARLGQAIRALHNGVERGERLAEVAAREGTFPPLAIRMLALGEETGTLEASLARISGQLDAEASRRVKRFFEGLDPLLKVVLAGVLIFVASAILLPIYTLIGGING